MRINPNAFMVSLRLLRQGLVDAADKRQAITAASAASHVPLLAIALYAMRPDVCGAMPDIEDKAEKIRAFYKYDEVDPWDDLPKCRECGSQYRVEKLYCIICHGCRVVLEDRKPMHVHADLGDADLEELALVSAGNFGEAREAWHPDYGKIVDGGQPTDAFAEMMRAQPGHHEGCAYLADPGTGYCSKCGRTSE